MGNVAPRGLFAKEGGTIQEVLDVHAKDAGTIKPAIAVYCRKAGVGIVKVWERNAAPAPVTGLGVTYSANGSASWNAVAAWILPADLDLATVWVRWTLAGVAGAWTALAAAAVSHTQAVASGSTVSVEVYVEDTGALVSTTKTASGGTSPLDQVPTYSVTQVGLDRVQVTWTHPAGAGRTGYRLAFTGGHVATYGESAGTTTRTVTITPGAATTALIYPLDNSTGVSRDGRERGDVVVPTKPAPGTPTVTAWSYSSITLGWTAATWADGGYEVWRSIGAGAFSLMATVGAGVLTYTGAVSQDTDYQYKVRAKGAGGGVGDYSGVRKPAIGHAAYSTVAAYSLAKSSNVYKDVADGPQPPSGQGIVLNLMTVAMTCTFSTSVASGTASRTLQYVANGAAGYGTGTKPNPWNETFGFGVTPNGGIQGLVARGTGWSSVAGGGFRLTGTITVSGDKTTDYPAVANGYW